MNRQTRNSNIHFLKLTIVIAIWASLYHIAKIATSVADVYLIAFLRYFFTAITFLPLHKLKTGYFWPKLDKQQWLVVAMVGFIGICLYNLLFFSAEMLISGNLVAIFYAFVPCITTILSTFIFKTRLNPLSKLGIGIALVGSLGVINYASPECQKFFCPGIFNDIGRGEIFGILAAFAFAGYSILSKYAAQKNVPAITITTYASVTGCIFLGLIALFAADFKVISSLPLIFWLTLIYMSVVATVWAYIWFTEAIVNLGVFKAATIQNTLPLQAVIIGYLFCGEKIGYGELICGMIILIGVYITNYGFKLKQKPNL